MTDLKPCPFCGGEARVEEYGDGYIPQCDHKYTCVIADCEFPADEWYISEGFAIEAWNARWERTCKPVRKGTSISCDACGSELHDPFRFCGGCGAKVEK